MSENFWDFGGDAPKFDNDEYDMGGAFDNLPEGVYCGICDNAEWRTFDNGDSVISLKWKVAGGDFDSRLIFQTIKVADSDQKKRMKAIKMLAAINAFTGGKLPSDRKPEDTDLMALIGSLLYLEVRIWKMDGKTGNFVNKVAKKSTVAQPKSKVPYDDDVPF